MGVEWEHGVFAADLALTGGPELAQEIDRLLRDFDLVQSVKNVWCLDQGVVRELPSLADADTAGVRNIGLRYESHASEGIAEQLHGERTSRPMSAYYADILVVAGTDFREFTAGEWAAVTTLSPPHLGHLPLERRDPDHESSFGHGTEPDTRLYPLYPSALYEAPAHATPPNTRLLAGPLDPDPAFFTGIWRIGLLIHFGKSIPEWAHDAVRVQGHGRPVTIADSLFKRSLTALFGGSLNQFGGFC